MILDIRHAFTDEKGELEIYFREKILYFASLSKKISLFDKNGESLMRPMKKGAFGKATLLENNKKKSLLILSKRDCEGKRYFGLLPSSRDRVYRAQILTKNGVNYLLLTHDKIPFAAAKIVDSGRSVCKLYLRDENKDLSVKVLYFVLLYLKTQKNNGL